MATYGPVQLPAFLSGDADFRAWAQGIHAALASFADLTQTADTGQIDLATVARPAAVNTAAGYEIWRFNDALQATVPVFIKIEYGTATLVDRPALWVTVATATNGAGTLTGAVTARLRAATGSSKAAGNVAPVLASAEPGRLDLAHNMDVSNTTYGVLFHLERTRDASGATTADGWWLAAAGSNNSSVGGHASYSSTLNAVANGNNSSDQSNFLPLAGPPSISFRSPVGADSAIGTVLYFLGKPVYGLGVVSMNGGEQAPLSTFSVRALGAVRTYVALGNSPSYVAASFAASIGMRWE